MITGVGYVLLMQMLHPQCLLNAQAQEFN